MMDLHMWYFVFTKVLNMSITASIVIVFVVLARFFLKKPRRYFLIYYGVLCYLGSYVRILFRHLFRC